MAPKRKAPEAPPPSPPSNSSDEEEEVVQDVEKSSQKAQNPESSDTGSVSEADEAKGKAAGAPRSGKSDAKGESSSGKPLFQRVRADQDEAAILRGMIDFCEKDGLDPTANVGCFHEYMKGKLSLDAEPEQLKTKMKNLKREFKKNDGKRKARKASKGRRGKVYELGKVLCGSEDGLSTNMYAPKSGGPPASSVWSDFKRKCGANDAFLMAGLGRIRGRERDELAGKWKKLQVEQLQIMSKQALLIHELVDRAISAYNKGSA